MMVDGRFGFFLAPATKRANNDFDKVGLKLRYHVCRNARRSAKCLFSDRPACRRVFEIEVWLSSSAFESNRKLSQDVCSNHR